MTALTFHALQPFLSHAGTAVRVPSQGLKGSLERVLQECIGSKEGTMVSGMRYGRHLSIPGAPHAFQALVPADARQYPLQMLWFPNIYSHLLRISISTEMLSETDSRNLLDFINL